MDEPAERRGLERPTKLTIAALEGGLAAFLVVLVVISIIKLAVVDLKRFVSAEGFDKQEFLHILDVALLIILAIDVLRTLVTAIIGWILPVRIVVEVAMLAILREFVAIEIRNLSNERILVLAAAFAVLMASWLLMSWFERGWRPRFMVPESGKIERRN
ncbi:MAG: phosphate-starvation-inducible PsiE family protein [Desulfurococcales archaeon]|nr:phosphate-starvation-inducible PsiE family protein [Desulfurococcales archaeon]